MIRFTNEADVLQEIEERRKRLDGQILSGLRRAGEKAVNQARAKTESGFAGRDWTDRTSNLRNSIGYGIVLNGNLLSRKGFQSQGEGQQGKPQGVAYLESLASRYPSGYVLIVVAGMSYASFVADRGYDVLDSAQLVSDAEIEKLVNRLSL